jgi:hypothetical protein
VGRCLASGIDRTPGFHINRVRGVDTFGPKDVKKEEQDGDKGRRVNFIFTLILDMCTQPFNPLRIVEFLTNQFLKIDEFLNGTVYI